MHYNLKSFIISTL